MASTQADHRRGQIRTYDRSSSVVFLKTKEAFGGLSNMAGGFPLLVSGVRIRTSEALYQACRFPHLPEVQRLIIAQRSPMTAKMKGKPYRRESRRDWNRVRVNVMRWCLRVKLAQNWTVFSKLLLDTGFRPIVEQSRKDDFWGAKPVDDQTFIGMNVLGRLLMELRESVQMNPQGHFLRVEPLSIASFLLDGRPIERVAVGVLEPVAPAEGAPARPGGRGISKATGTQSPLVAPIPPRLPFREDPTRYVVDQGACDLNPYPAYKDSGVEWLGNVPAHWQVRRLKNVAGVVMGQSPSSEDCSTARIGLPFIQGCAEFGSDHPEPVQFCRAPAKVSPAGAILLSVRAPVGRLNVADQRYGIGRGLCAVVPRPSFLDASFCRYNLGSSTVGLTLQSTGSTYDAVSVGDVACLRTIVPSIPEQAAIVRFLDHADRCIRRYIRAKQKLIALLEEQKQAIIHQAVTGQIDARTGRPYPAYKSSGLEWLEDVPEHWQVKRSKRVFMPRRELARANDIQLSATQAYGVISQQRYEETVGRKVVRILRHLEQRRHVEVDDFVISMRSFQGGLERAWESGCIRSSYIVLRPASKLVVGYFGYLFKSVGYINALQATANFIRDGQDLNFENYCRVDLPFPSIEEQQRIAQFLDQTTTAIRSTVERYCGQVGLVREYRTRLIADIVTGKLDVREAAAGLPQVDPLAAEDDPGDGSNQEAGLDSDEFGVAGQEAEA